MYTWNSNCAFYGLCALVPLFLVSYGFIHFILRVIFGLRKILFLRTAVVICIYIPGFALSNAPINTISSATTKSESSSNTVFWDAEQSERPAY